MGRLSIKVSASASRDALAGWMGETLKIKVTAPPEKGKANAAVIRLLAAALRVPPRDIMIESGHTSPGKRVIVRGVDDATLRRRLEGGTEAGCG